jgi:hypothetical protein
MPEPMQEKQEKTDRPRGLCYRFSCPCGLRLLASRIESHVGAYVRNFVAFFQVTTYNGVAKGRRVSRCPKCRRDLPAIGWEEFQEQAWPGGMAW